MYSPCTHLRLTFLVAPKYRSVYCTQALGAFSFTMDALPGTPRIRNIIPTTFFGTTTWAAPVLGLIGSFFIFATGVGYLTFRVSQTRGEGTEQATCSSPSSLPKATCLPLVLPCCRCSQFLLTSSWELFSGAVYCSRCGFFYRAQGCRSPRTRAPFSASGLWKEPSFSESL